MMTSDAPIIRSFAAIIMIVKVTVPFLLSTFSAIPSSKYVNEMIVPPKITPRGTSIKLKKKQGINKINAQRETSAR